MATIVYVIPSPEVQSFIEETIQEHRQYFAHIYPDKVYSDIQTLVKTTADFIDSENYNADVIIARGLMATRLKKSFPSIPVVETPVTVSDIMEAFDLFRKTGLKPRKIALIGLGMILHQTQLAAKQYDVEMVPIDYLYTPTSPDIVKELFEKAVSRGFSFFMGGATLVKRAEAAGFHASFVSSCKDSIWLALTEAQHIAAIRREERERAVRFKTILNGSTEGIITTNSKRWIIQINATAGKILGIDPDELKGSHIESLIPDPRFIELLRREGNFSNEIFKIGNKRIILNKVSASLGDEMIGNVFSFQNVEQVRMSEIKIRSELHRKGLTARYHFEDLIGTSRPIREAKERARIFAEVPSNVLITGETGTGKELFAQSMHNSSTRAHAPFVAVNCAAIPAHLIESEFFGYVGGAFTGASKEGRMGLFELAHEGTLFLDEVSEIPVNLQSKLLRVIQEGEVMRLGHDKIIPVNVRMICASNKDLKVLTREGSFREDLYYRLAVLQLHIPPLHERGTDAGAIADHFISYFSANYSSHQKQLTDRARSFLNSRLWEGNIRELRNVCEQLVVLSRETTIDRDDVLSLFPDSDSHRAPDVPGFLSEESGDMPGSSDGRGIQNMEKLLIEETLKKHNYNKTACSQALGIDRSTLWRKMRRYGIECSQILSS